MPNFNFLIIKLRFDLNQIVLIKFLLDTSFKLFLSRPIWTSRNLDT